MTATAMKTEEIIRALLASGNLGDVRKGECIRRVHALEEGLWKGRFRIAGYAVEQRSLVVLSEMRVRGWLWENGRPHVHDRWLLATALPSHYPAAMPLVRFLDKVPFNPHVVSRHHLPETAGMPPELQEYVRNGNDGLCCYLKGSEWSPKESMGLPFVYAQVSRVLVGYVHGEAMSLNPVARDWAIRHADQLPLGPPLPWPSRDQWAAAPTAGGEPEAIDWIEEDPT